MEPIWNSYGTFMEKLKNQHPPNTYPSAILTQ